MRPPVARLVDVSKSFHGNVVLRTVSLDLLPGEIHVLAGENGAGKSTLIRVLGGIHRPDSGRVLIDDVPVELDTPLRARSAGIAVVHQELSLVPTLSVADNLSLGREARGFAGRLDRRTALASAEEALRRVNARIHPTARVEHLSTGQQQLVEIARALSERPRLLILDEPTAALSEHEAQLLSRIVTQLRDDGLAILYISHRMAEITKLADRVTVLRDGMVADSMTAASVDPERIVTSMVGRPLSDLYAHDRPPISGRTRLTVSGLTDGARTAPASFSIRAGEVLGLAGLVGSGRTELARLIAGADRAHAGSVHVDDVPVDVGSTRAALSAGIVLLPESRKEQGLVPGMSIADNICLGTGAARRSFGRFSRSAARQTASRYRDAMRIKATSVDQKVDDLSGGNQQKVLLGRCLDHQPKILILDEPTRGVDVGAKADIYRLINEIAAGGVAILLISSELIEVLGLSDRVLVMREGGIVAELQGDDLTEQTAMRHATGTEIGPVATSFPTEVPR